MDRSEERKRENNPVFHYCFFWFEPKCFTRWVNERLVLSITFSFDRFKRVVVEFAVLSFNECGGNAWG